MFYVTNQCNLMSSASLFSAYFIYVYGYIENIFENWNISVCRLVAMYEICSRIWEMGTIYYHSSRSSREKFWWDWRILWRENWIFLLFLIIPAEGTRSYEVPRHPECGDSSEVFTLQRNQTRQHQRRGHCRRQPQAYTRPHMDHHPSLPGRRLSSHPQQTPLTPPHFVWLYTLYFPLLRLALLPGIMLRPR